MDIFWAFYCINIASWTLVIYQETAERFGYQYGIWSAKGYLTYAGLLSLVLSIYYMSEYYSFWLILLHLFLTGMFAGWGIAKLRELAQSFNMALLLLGYILLIYLK